MNHHADFKGLMISPDREEFCSDMLGIHPEMAKLL